MSYRVVQSLIRPTLRTATRAPTLLVRAATPLPLSPPLSFSRTKKTKASKKSAATLYQEGDEEYADGPGKGKGGKKGKGKMLTEDELTDMQLPGEKFELKVLEERMKDGIERLRVSLKTVVGRVGRVSPALLDNIKVETPEGKRPLNEFATVSVKDGKDLLVTCYEEAGVKPVTAAIYASPLNLTPQPSGATSIRVPVPKPDWDKRQGLVRDAQDLCEKARIAIRQTRNDGQKEIKKDVDGKVIGKEEGRQEGKKLDEGTKKKTAEVDKIFEDAKKVLMDE
ncbi:Rrf1p [Sporobolomyces salmoneus]|uniref:Rrf1p n=1 Tax=Sporobolomyces salmoneus TaxID=183962 RepID=UPI00316F7A05